MVEIEPDVGRNRLIIRFVGQVDKDALPVAERQLTEALSRLRPPIDVLSDIRELTGFGEGLTDEFKRVSRVIGAFGTRRIVRVVGRSAQAAVLMARMARHLRNHEAHLAYSLEEAEQVFLSRSI